MCRNRFSLAVPADRTPARLACGGAGVQRLRITRSTACSAGWWRHLAVRRPCPVRSSPPASRQPAGSPFASQRQRGDGQFAAVSACTRVCSDGLPLLAAIVENGAPRRPLQLGDDVAQQGLNRVSAPASGLPWSSKPALNDHVRWRPSISGPDCPLQWSARRWQSRAAGRRRRAVQRQMRAEQQAAALRAFADGSWQGRRLRSRRLGGNPSVLLSWIDAQALAPMMAESALALARAPRNAQVAAISTSCCLMKARSGMASASLRLPGETPPSPGCR